MKTEHIVVGLCLIGWASGMVGTSAVPGDQADADTATKPAPTQPVERRPVDLVICLDTSGSMTALIDSARMKLWAVVNELAQAKPVPRLRVGLLTYGSPNVSTPQQGWIVRQIDLTSDLDAVHERMMALTTTGGDEFVGWVLHDALANMSWSDDAQALKLVFVAGNESADQAVQVHDFRHVAEQAAAQDIIINAIFAGNAQQGINQKWQEVAEYGRGTYSAIDMQAGTVQIATPQDELLRQLNEQLNATYLAYGKNGKTRQANQKEQDDNAAKLGPESGAGRVAAKASLLYENEAWDLVDADKNEAFDIKSVALQDLPVEMQAMSDEQRKDHVQEMSARRSELQEQIQKVSGKRDAFLGAQRAQNNPEKTSLDQAIRRTVREQAQAKGFQFEDVADHPE